ncbi:MAG: Crp/Fnr family transcriptional regulator, partial [Caulobacteraceae bacterium]
PCLSYRGIDRVPYQMSGIDLRPHMSWAPSREVTQHRAGSEMPALGDSFLDARFVVSGWGCRARGFEDGREQITSLILPGDLLTAPSPFEHNNIIALTPMTTAKPADWYRRSVDHIEQRFERDKLRHLDIQGSLMFNQLVRLGKLNARERLANFLMEIYTRSAPIGLAARERFTLPMSQASIANVIGVSTVQVSRSFTSLRDEELIQYKPGSVIITGMGTLRRVALFLDEPSIVKVASSMGT